jgi:adenylate kinase family enzyme
MKNFIIGGVPRSGKSILSKRLCSTLAMAYFPLDSLVSTFGRVFPELGISHTSEDHIAVCDQLWPFVCEWITHLVYEDLSFLFDGYHLQPTNIRKDIDPQAFNILFLGYPHAQPAQKAAEIRQYARKGDWTETLDEEALTALVRRYIDESKHLQAECLQYGFDFIDLSHGFPNQLTEVSFAILELSRD